MVEPMKTSPNGRKFVEAWEELYVSAYDDGTGTLTIGYGHTSAAGLPRVYRGMVITQAQADAILSSDLAAVEADVNHHVQRQLSQEQFDALVSFDFNSGELDRSNVLVLVNKSDFADVRAALMTWVHGRVHGHLVTMPGLVRRRQAEWTLFSTGKVVGP